MGMGISPVPWHLSRHRPPGRSLTWLLDSTSRDFVALPGVCNTLFIRHYFEGASWCLFRRLLICLNSASGLLCGRVGTAETRRSPCASTTLRHPSHGASKSIASANTCRRAGDRAHKGNAPARPTCQLGGSQFLIPQPTSKEITHINQRRSRFAWAAGPVHESRSRIRLLTEWCTSQCVSQFAVLFIEPRC